MIKHFFFKSGHWYFRCPVDNTWSNTVFEDNAAKREVLSLKVECTNNTNKCDWHGELRELETHVKTCMYEQIECPNACSTLIIKKDIEKHLEECPKRIEKCEHCSCEVIATQMARHHLLECQKFPANCPMCGDAQISRENINSHLNVISGDCPMTVVPCSFRHIGCLYQDQRCRMPQHYKDSNTQHIMMLSTRLVDLETKHRVDLEVCAKKFEQSIQELTKRIDFSEKRNFEIENELNKYKMIYGPIMKSASSSNNHHST